MSGILIISIVALLAMLGYVLYFVHSRKSARVEKISEILSRADLLAHWTYTPEEWRAAVEDEFTWVRHRDSVGHVYISPDAIYIKNDFEDSLIELGGSGRVVTHASYRGADGSPLKLRVRWKIVSSGDEGPDEVKYYKEDYRIPVPLRHREEATRVAEFFTARVENNLEAYADVMPDDEPLSIFGKDSF
jgi:hypothetical protein